jgi:DNA repair protein RecO (recombination protein O)
VGDYERLRLAYLMAQMVDRLMSDSSSQPGVYRLLSYSLRELDESGASSTSQLFFKLRLLSQLGYKPQLEVCAVCGAGLDPAYLSAEHGGAVCAACRSADSEAITANQLGLWRRLYEADLSATTPADDELALATLPLCDTFYEYIFGRAFLVAA